jgi:hypothetical protein
LIFIDFPLEADEGCWCCSLLLLNLDEASVVDETFVDDNMMEESGATNEATTKIEGEGKS